MARVILTCALLLGCGSDPFLSAESFDGGAVLVAAAWSDAGAAAGAPSVGGAAGAAGAPSGGASAEAGAGGAPEPAADGGVDGTLSGPPDAVADGVTPACGPPMVAPGSMPEAMAWEDFGWQESGACTRCTRAPCTTCGLDWFPVEQDGAHVTAVLSTSDCGAVAISAGPCGAEVEGCASWQYVFYGEVRFELIWEGGAWRPSGVDVPLFVGSLVGADLRGMCGADLSFAPPDQLEAMVTEDLVAAVEAQRWECPKF